jgi:PEP-CTERM motif
MKPIMLLLSSITAIFAFSHDASAAALTGELTADDAFAAYISTSNSTLGTLVSGGNYWPSTYNLSTPLTSGNTYYLHVIADNNLYYGTSSSKPVNADGFLGQFNITGSGFHFANGTQELLTNTSDWSASPNTGSEQLLNANGSVKGSSIGSAVTTWIAPIGSPLNEGTNAGPSYWSENYSGDTHPLIALDANWIWSSTDPSGEAFFSTKINPNSFGTPEPSTWAMMILGFLGIGAMTYRRRKSALSAV